MTRIPTLDSAATWRVARAWRQHGHILGALEAFHDELGDVFRLPLPGFNSVFLVGPEANKFLLTESRNSFLWRAEGDPVTRLLRHGLLVEDGESHDALRKIISPALHKTMLDDYLATMLHCTDRVIDQWRDGDQLDLLTEMRRVALLILTDTLFHDDFDPYIKALWNAILRTIRYISPGAWLVWPGIPRPGYRHALQQMNEYCYQLIARRRTQIGTSNGMLGRLILSGMPDDLIRDQLLTMFIAGHDTSTALLAWSLYLLSTHRDILARVQAELDSVLDEQTPTLTQLRQLSYLDSVLKETLRLYPPIHLGSRIAANDIAFQEYRIPAGTRVLYSLYLTHRHKKYWPAPERFDPERFTGEQAGTHSAYTFIPFGGGPRNCIGAAFAQVEAKVVLARILQRFDLRFIGGAVHPHMRATLEPRPGVQVEVRQRLQRHAQLG